MEGTPTFLLVSSTLPTFFEPGQLDARWRVVGSNGQITHAEQLAQQSPSTAIRHPT
jgi:hypothetical protein